MAIQERQLGQLRPGTTTATSIFSPAASTTTFIKVIVVCNTSNSSAKYSIYQDDDGTTYDESTALFFEQLIVGKKTILIEFLGPGMAMKNSAGNLAVQTDTINALTFTVSGGDIT